MLFDLKILKEKYNLNIKGVIHIGAHFGQEFDSYKELQIPKIVFFEPNPKSFKILNEKVKNYTNVKLFNLALGNFTGNVEMNVEFANNGQSNSILKPKLHLEQYPHIRFIEKIKVPIDKLENIKISTIDYNFINIDVQGYELEVFKGATKTLQNIDYIITEINREELYENCTKVEDLDDFLSQFNFKRVETNWAGHSWGDGFYIKEK